MNKLVIIIVSVFCIVSCSEVFEEDITHCEVVILSPADSLVTLKLDHTFWWENVEGATKYTLQIVKGNFVQAETLELDSTVEVTHFEHTFSNPGLYTWRLKALNNGYETEYIYRTLTIDSSQNLEGQKLVLTAPVDNFVTSSTDISFQWNVLYNADNYRFSISSETKKLLDNLKLTSTGISIPADTVLNFIEDTYTWSVYAENSTPSQSAVSQRTIIFDYTPPQTPLLYAPVNDTILTNTEYEFRWKSGVDANFSYDSLYIYTNTLGGTVFKAIKQTNEKYTVSGLVSGVKYVWEVVTFDKAGNRSSDSESGSFRIQ